MIFFTVSGLKLRVRNNFFFSQAVQGFSVRLVNLETRDHVLSLTAGILLCP